MNNETLLKITRHIALAAARLEKLKPRPEVIRSDHKISSIGSRPQVLVQPVKNVEPRQEIDWGKINKFIADPLVTIIECSGPGKPIKIRRGGNISPSSETLTLGEMMSLLNQFSHQAKVPLTQMFKARIENLSITAFVSPVAGTRFMIIKS